MVSSYNAIYRDVFNFHKERASKLVGTEAFWRETLAMMTAILEQHGYSELCSDLLLAVYSELERKVR